jgi:hypothetical protein
MHVTQLLKLALFFSYSLIDKLLFCPKLHNMTMLVQMKGGLPLIGLTSAGVTGNVFSGN